MKRGVPGGRGSRTERGIAPLDAGFRHPKCVFGRYSECSRQLSREHYMSKAILEALGRFTIHQSRWGEAGTAVGIGSLTVRNMCTRHNSRLSALDGAAHALFHALRVGGVSADLDGVLVERWMLKLLVGAMHAQVFALPAMTGPPRLGDEALQLLLGRCAWPPELGMWLVEVNQRADWPTHIPFAMAPHLGAAGQVNGMVLGLHGVTFFLALAPPAVWSGDVAKVVGYRPSRVMRMVADSAGAREETRVDFRWPATGGDPVIMLRILPPPAGPPTAE